MEELDYWRLNDQLTIIQAAILACGDDPSTMQGYVESQQAIDQPQGYVATKTAISNALRNGEIDGELVPLVAQDFDENQRVEIENSIDLEASWVKVGSLRSWLSSCGIRTGFFFAAEPGEQDYLDPNHPRYAPKLAAAVEAWLATGDSSAIRGRSVKKSLIKWLRKNAAKFGLSDKDGKPNETGIEEIAKVANWQPIGGAPKTPDW